MVPSSLKRYSDSEKGKGVMTDSRLLKDQSLAPKLLASAMRACQDPPTDVARPIPDQTGLIDESDNGVGDCAKNGGGKTL